MKILIFSCLVFTVTSALGKPQQLELQQWQQLQLQQFNNGGGKTILLSVKFVKFPVKWKEGRVETMFDQTKKMKILCLFFGSLLLGSAIGRSPESDIKNFKRKNGFKKTMPDYLHISCRNWTWQQICFC